MKKFEWIIFDLSGPLTQFVLQDTKPFTINGKKLIPAHYEKIYFADNYKNYMRGDISYKDFVEPILKKIKPQLTLREFKQIYHHTIKLEPGIIDLLEELKNKYKLAILSNEGTEFGNWKIDQVKLRSYFEKIFISAELGCLKPEKEIYQQTLTQLKTKAENCLFIDDLERNVIGAKKVGLEAILFKNVPDLQKQLAETLNP